MVTYHHWMFTLDCAGLMIFYADVTRQYTDLLTVFSGFRTVWSSPALRTVITHNPLSIHQITLIHRMFVVFREIFLVFISTVIFIFYRFPLKNNVAKMNPALLSLKLTLRSCKSNSSQLWCWQCDVSIEIIKNNADVLRSQTLLVAEDSYFNLFVQLFNHGDNSYNTSLTLFYPLGLSFSRMILTEGTPSQTMKVCLLNPTASFCLWSTRLRLEETAFRKGFVRR